MSSDPLDFLNEPNGPAPPPLPTKAVYAGAIRSTPTARVNPSLVKFGIAGALILIIGIALVLFSAQSNRRVNNSASNSSNAVAPEMPFYFCSGPVNHLQFERDYVGKYTQIHSCFFQVRRTVDGTPAIYLRSAMNWVIECRFSESQFGRLAELRPCEEVTVRGLCQGEDVFDNCELVSVKETAASAGAKKPGDDPFTNAILDSSAKGKAARGEEPPQGQTDSGPIYHPN